MSFDVSLGSCILFFIRIVLYCVFVCCRRSTLHFFAPFVQFLILLNIVVCIHPVKSAPAILPWLNNVVIDSGINPS